MPAQAAGYMLAQIARAEVFAAVRAFLQHFRAPTDALGPFRDATTPDLGIQNFVGDGAHVEYWGVARHSFLRSGTAQT